MMILRVWDVTFTVSDLERAADFYEHVLGLSKKYQFSTYVGFDCGGVEIGLVPGVPRQARDAAPRQARDSAPRQARDADPAGGQDGAPCVDLLVRDVDEAYRGLRKRGVRFLKEPHDTLWGSRIALFTDPDGNVLQLVQIDWRRYFTACASG